MQRANHILLIPVLALFALFALAAAVLPSSPARAASYGPGFDLGLGRIGAYVAPNGAHAYCLEIDKDRPLGPTDDGTVGGWGDLDADALARLNWVLHSYGQSADPVVTAAVNLYVWSVGDPATYDSHGMSGDEYYSGRAGASRDEVLAVLSEIRAGAAAVPPAGSVTVELSPDLTGRVVVADPAGRGATLTIEGAGDPGPHAVADGTVIDFVATPEPGDRTARVTATAVFAARSYPPTITVYDSGPAQRLAGPSGDALGASASAEVPLEFHPVLRSAVEEPVLAVGTAAVDRLEVTVDDSSPAPWRPGQSVVARGTLYGPFPSVPVEAATAPQDAPVAWTELIEFDGPGDFASSGGFAPTEPGHYTWVWSIQADDQPDGSLLPEDYAWRDRFGLAAESFEVVAPLPSTGAELDAGHWLTGAGVLLLGGGLVAGAACMRIRLRPAAPSASPAALPRRRRRAAR